MAFRRLQNSIRYFSKDLDVGRDGFLIERGDRLKTGTRTPLLA